MRNEVGSSYKYFGALHLENGVGSSYKYCGALHLEE